MKLYEIHRTEVFVPINEDPFVPRCPKVVVDYNEDGVAVGEHCVPIKLGVMPEEADLDIKKADRLSDPQVFASVILRNEGTDIETMPRTDSFHAYSTIQSLKDES